MSLDPNKLDLYGDNDENDIFFPGQHEYEILQELKASNRDAKFAKIISIISIIIAIASLIVALFSMPESRFEWLKQLLKIPMQFLGFY